MELHELRQIWLTRAAEYEVALDAFARLGRDAPSDERLRLWGALDAAELARNETHAAYNAAAVARARELEKQHTRR